MTDLEMDNMDVPRGSVEFDLDQDRIYPAERKFSLGDLFRRRRLFILLLLALCTITLLVTISLSIVLPVVLVKGGNESSGSSNLSSEETDSTVDDTQDIEYGNTLYFGTRIKNTTESQIDLYQMPNWIDRETQAQTWINFMEQHSKYLNLSNSQITEITRRQKLLSAKACNNRYEFRTREGLAGDGEGDGYIDIKGNNDLMDKACTLPFEPAALYATNTSQKCELDLHECPDDDKYSRETRIFFKSPFPDFATCGDLYQLYPSAFDEDFSAEDARAGLSVRMDQVWWAKKYIGFLDGDTKYEITFTVRYHSMDDAMDAMDPVNNVLPADGEWSIRLYSLGEGFTDDWNEDVVADVASMYDQLMQAFGRPGYCD